MVQIVDTPQPNRVSKIFCNKTLFVTGGSGFLGKVLIEKLLRSCTDLKKIYILLRAKKGKNINVRLQEIFDGPLFDVVKKQYGKCIFDKVEAIAGDIAAPDLGLTLEDRKKLIEETEIIYHSAATVQFDESFQKTVLLNVRGTKLMLGLARECKKLMIFCHLSTAYCHEDQEILYEKTYPPPADPYRIIDICEWMDEKTLDIIAHQIRGSSANNYTFTKALGEALVADQMDNLPVIIQRPSAVVPIWKEPLPGWTDNINGPTGLLLGGGKGVIRTMYGRSDYFADYVSVDCVANGLICTTYDYLTYSTRRVYNMTASDEVKITFEEVINTGETIMHTIVPFDWVLWYPGGSLTSSRFIHYVRFLLLQLLPALFIDIIIFMLGHKPFLLRVQKKIWRGYQVFEYYANRKWNFRKDNGETIRNLLNAKEKEIFKVDSKGFDCYEYFVNCSLGARRYLLKEKDENIPAALRRMKLLWFIDKICKIIFVCGMLYLLFKTLVVPFFRFEQF